MPLFFGENSESPVTAILDDGGNQIFESVGILNVSAASSKAYPQHTLENGVQISDHSIELQDRVTLRTVLNPDDYIEVYRRIKKAFKENSEFIIQTKVETYTKLYIEELPHEEDAKNTVLLNLSFIEQRFQSPNVDSLPQSEVANVADSDTQNAGNKQAQEIEGEEETTTLDSLLGGFI